MTHQHVYCGSRREGVGREGEILGGGGSVCGKRGGKVVVARVGEVGKRDLIAPDLRVLCIPDDVLRQVILQASHPAQNRTAIV